MKRTNTFFHNYIEKCRKVIETSNDMMEALERLKDVKCSKTLSDIGCERRNELIDEMINEEFKEDQDFINAYA